MKILLELTGNQLNVLRNVAFYSCENDKVSKEELKDLRYALLDKITNKNE